MTLTYEVFDDFECQRVAPNLPNLLGLLDEKLSDVTVTVHGHYSNEAAKSYRLHRVTLSGKTHCVDLCYLCVYSGFVCVIERLCDGVIYTAVQQTHYFDMNFNTLVCVLFILLTDDDVAQ